MSVLRFSEGSGRGGNSGECTREERMGAEGWVCERQRWDCCTHGKPCFPKLNMNRSSLEKTNEQIKHNNGLYIYVCWLAHQSQL